jgi:addiction module HigA family antidote
MTYEIRREPTGPGEILQEEFLTPLGLTQKQLADHIRCDVKVINRIVNGRTSVGAGMAVKLAASLGTSPQFWLNAQQAVDIYRAERELKYRPGSLVSAG